VMEVERGEVSDLRTFNAAREPSTAEKEKYARAAVGRHPDAAVAVRSASRRGAAGGGWDRVPGRRARQVAARARARGGPRAPVRGALPERVNASPPAATVSLALDCALDARRFARHGARRRRALAAVRARSELRRRLGKKETLAHLLCTISIWRVRAGASSGRCIPAVG